MMKAAVSIPKVMRAVQATGAGGPEVLSVKTDVAVPQFSSEVEKKKNEVLIKVAASAVNRADTMQRKGMYPPPPGASSLLGLEASGTIAALPEDSSSSSKWKVGDKVMCLLSGGGNAEYVVAHSNQCMPIPARCPDLVTAAGIPEVFLTAYQCCRIAGLKTRIPNNKEAKKKKNVLIHAGASGVGTALCQIVSALGAEPVITASAEKLKDPIVQKVCPKYRFERDNAPPPPPPAQAQEGQPRPATPPAPLPKWVAEIEKSLGKNCIDFVVDPVVGSGYLQGDVELLGMDGTIVILAMMAGSTIPRFNVAPLFRKRGQIIGSTLRSRPDDYKGELVKDFMENVHPLLFAEQAEGEEGGTSIEPIISAVLPLDEIQNAHKKIDGNECIGKVLLQVSS